LNDKGRQKQAVILYKLFQDSGKYCKISQIIELLSMKFTLFGSRSVRIGCQLSWQKACIAYLDELSGDLAYLK
jgi:hypothetical protein